LSIKILTFNKIYYIKNVKILLLSPLVSGFVGKITTKSKFI